MSTSDLTILRDESISNQIRKLAVEQFSDLSDSNQESLISIYKRFISSGKELVMQFHRSSINCGLKVTHANSVIIDIVIEDLFKRAIYLYNKIEGKLPCEVCVVALGGYGRSELSPHSDIDIMLLYPSRIRQSKLEPFQKHLHENILVMLWDVGLKLGQSSRTLNEVVDQAKSDIKTKNSLLEARYLSGSNQLYERFSQAYKNYYRKDSPQEYIKICMRDLKIRRERYGNTVFIQEPDIKNGVGGLRDFQLINWMAKIKLDIATIDDLVKNNYLQQAEYRDFIFAYDYLLRVRNELHYQSPRLIDLLDLEKQPKVALAIGYNQEDSFVRVEVFMKDYYRHASQIYHTSQILEQRLAIQNDSKISLKSLLKSRYKPPKKNIDGFIISGRTLSANSPQIFKEDPGRLIRVFRHSQQSHANMDFDLKCLIRDSLTLITTDVINSASANRSFRSILQTVGDVYPTLYLMHDFGVLGRFIPEWNELYCLVQHEYFHRYTADIHTLNTIKELDKLFTTKEDILTKYNSEIHNTEPTGLLYLILLFHDIGKGSGIKGHSERGVEIASPILDRLGVEPKLKNTILFVIEHHLSMMNIWQHYDVEDPKTLKKFAALVQNERQLRYLYIHTFCDARGTSSSLWNSYKDILHTQLFKNTLEYLGDKETVEKHRRKRKAKTSLDNIASLVPEITSEEIEAHYDLLPEQYFEYNRTNQIALHLKLIHKLLTHFSNNSSTKALIPIFDWKNDLDRSLTIVNLVTWNRAGMFYKICGAFSLAGLSIMSSKAISRNDQIIIDTFYVSDTSGEKADENSAKSIFEKNLVKTFVDDTDLLPDIISFAKKLQKRPSILEQTSTISNAIRSSVDLIYDKVLNKIIITVKAHDKIGLLYRLTKTIFDQGFDITFARISTEQGIAIDTFHVNNNLQEEFEVTETLLTLREKLNDIVSDDVEFEELNLI